MWLSDCWADGRWRERRSQVDTGAALTAGTARMAWVHFQTWWLADCEGALSVWRGWAEARRWQNQVESAQKLFDSDVFASKWRHFKHNTVTVIPTKLELIIKLNKHAFACVSILSQIKCSVSNFFWNVNLPGFSPTFSRQSLSPAHVLSLPAGSHCFF